MIIGIASRCIIENQVRKEFVNEEYISFFKKYGLTPILLPYNLSSYQELFSLCDCFCLPGGGDIDAKFYNSINDIHNQLVYKDVDKLDFLILKYALKKRKPVLGICRGLQVINVFFKGDLTSSDTLNSIFIFDSILLSKSSLFWVYSFKSFKSGFSIVWYIINKT